MPRAQTLPKDGTGKKPIEQYDHKDKKRVNNPPVGLVHPENDPDQPAKKYAYDPGLDPQLVWSGKAERTSFEVPTVSLHVHERIDPRTIIEAVRKRNGNGQPAQGSFLFERREENPPLREAIDFYKHPHGWSNRLIAGDSLLVMNSLLEKEGMAGQVQMVYIDPPYGIKYGSNFQPFVMDNSRARVSRPLTVEAVPAPSVRSISEAARSALECGSGAAAFDSEGSKAVAGRPQSKAVAGATALQGAFGTDVARTGETLRQSEWRDVLLRGGVRGKGGQTVDFSRVEPLAGTRWLHADAETKGAKPERVVISFGPEYAPLETRQVESAWEEARHLSPRPSILLLVYSDIDPEAGKDIAELTPEKAGMTFLGAKIDADVWTKDLKKKARTSSSVY